MLALNSLGDNSASTRVSAAERPKAKGSEELRPHADFESYVAALSQPLRTESPVKNQTPQQDTTPAVKTGEGSAPREIRAGETIYDAAPQKAGNEKPAERDVAAQSPQERIENSDTKAAQVRIVRADRELIETLGLKLKTNAATAAAKTESPAQAAMQQVQKVIQNVQPQAVESRVVKNKTENVTSTLSLLQKSPDMVLLNADGLKRLGEKLGFAFLGRVGEKVIERNVKADTPMVNAKQNDKSEIVAMAAPQRHQKAGDGASQSQSESQSQARSTRASVLRAPSRETTATENLTALNGTKTESITLASPAVHETSTMRQHHATLQTADLRLSEAAASARTTDNIRVAVENPMLRADLVRQFNEIMGRAQVLVTDTQNAQFSVKLFPREIGRMEIDLKMVDGEIRGKIVVESEDVKNEMQNFLQNRDQQGEQQLDLKGIDIEVRNGNQNAQNPQRAPEAEEILQNLVTRAAATSYAAPETTTTQGNGLYA